MKLTTLLLIIAFVQASAAGYSQVRLSAKNTSLETVFGTIKKQTGYTFFYDLKDIRDVKISVQINDATLNEALDKCLANLPLNYEIKDKTVFVSKKDPSFLDKIKTAFIIPVTVTGRVTDTTGTALPNATVTITGQNKGTQTGADGNFRLNAQVGDRIMVSFIGYTPYTFSVTEGMQPQSVVLHAVAGRLNEVVVVNTGYQTLPKERATGSFVVIDNELLNRRVSTNILDRLDGVTSGLIFNKNAITGNTIQQANSSALTIRGRSTINANPNPLIVIDNFPYDGDLGNINPNDVENITILKDAAAASIWGARASNGVIVITTKKGRYNQPVKVSINTNLTIGDKPDLYYQPKLNATDYISIEQFLFNNNFYNATSKTTVYSPVVELLIKKKNGLIDSASTAAQLNYYRNQDARNDQGKYFYQKSINQQYNINISGGSANDQYYISTGYDNNLPNPTYNGYQRVTANVSNTISLLKQKLEISTNLEFTQSNTQNNNNYSAGKIYENLVDANGNALPVQIYNRQTYLDTIGHGKLLDWAYRPLDEIKLSNNTTTLIDYRLNVGIKYKILPGLDANVLYQYNNGISNNQNYHDPLSYFSRNLTNTYSLINYGTNSVTYRVPVGGILDMSSGNYSTNNARFLLNYTHTFNNDHQFTGIIGAEVKSIENQNRASRLYGYNLDLQTSIPVDFVTLYPTIPSGSSIIIPNNISNLKTINRFVDYFTNIAYTYKGKYTLSFSAREDESNLFGVNTNQKGVPLGSIGVAWDISKEGFYHFAGIPFLKLRLTDGYNGNLDNNASALATAVYSTGVNSYGTSLAINQNPPNPSLRWEKVNLINAGLEFATAKNILNGSIDYYVKHANDLLANSLIAPQSGVSSVYINSADIQVTGIDVILNSTNLNGRFKWSSTLLFNYATDKVTAYNLKPSTISSYLLTGLFNPVIGKPLYSLYSYYWAGLDNKGNPQGILDGQISENYSGLSSSANFDNLKYNGPLNPPIFGSFRNTFAFKQISLSFNISYKFGYYFRRPSINYSSLGWGNPDYDLRWQKAGDEAITNVPSMIYPLNAARDAFYNNSEILVDKGDHIRLQDIQLSYDLRKKDLPKLPFQTIRFYLYANNIGILWRANKDNIDPDVVPVTNAASAIYPNPRTISFGVKMDF